jgi:hypothetical protein
MKFTSILWALLLGLFPLIGKSGDFGGAVGAEYLSNITKRGVVLYNSFQVIPIWALDLGSPNFQLVGTTLNYKKSFQKDTIVWRTRLVPSATPDKPLYTTQGNIQPNSKKRTPTGEWDNYLEIHVRNRAESRILISQDISVHKGTYLEFMQRIVLGNWLERNGKPMLQPALFASVGWGSAGHNNYLYGRGAGLAGFTDWSYGLLVGSPGAIDTFYPTLQITRFHVLGPAKSGTFVEGRASGTQVIALAAFKIF